MSAAKAKPPRKAEGATPTSKRALLLRLKRTEGQVRGLQRMVEQERYCPEVLVQISAVQESLRGVARLLMRGHLEQCATSAIRRGDEQLARATYAELTDLFYKHAR